MSKALHGIGFSRGCLLGWLGLSFMALGCVYLEQDVDYEKGTDFSRYHTFFVERARPLDASGSTVEDDAQYAERVEAGALAQIRVRLVEKGFVEAAADEADIHVHYYVTTRAEVHASDRPGHVRWLREDIREIAYESYTRGTLVIDIADRERNLLVWHGVVEGVVKTSSLPTDGKTVVRAVNRLMRQFPPRWTGS